MYSDADHRTSRPSRMHKSAQENQWRLMRWQTVRETCPTLLAIGPVVCVCVCVCVCACVRARARERECFPISFSPLTTAAAGGSGGTSVSSTQTAVISRGGVQALLEGGCLRRMLSLTVLSFSENCVPCVSMCVCFACVFDARPVACLAHQNRSPSPTPSPPKQTAIAIPTWPSHRQRPS